MTDRETSCPPAPPRGSAAVDSHRRTLLAGSGLGLLGALAGCAPMPPQAGAAAPAAAAATPPPNPAAGEYRTAREQLDALAARKVSSLELVDQAIAGIEARDGPINAVVVRDFERAREAARAADAARAGGDRRPLLGLPMTVKEAFNVAGLPTTWGFPNAKGWRAEEDALIVARAKAAGAVVLGKTNVPIALADWQSYNDNYGTTNNPWDLGRTPGGSSGGAAASLAAGYVPLELGSDIGGSLRVPAHYCGVFAHKPSQGLVPSRGHTPPRAPAQPRDTDLAVVGPMARSAADLAMLLDVVAGPDPQGGVGYRLELQPPRRQRLQDFRVLMLDQHPLLPTAKSVTGALNTLAERLRASGVNVARESPLVPDLSSGARIYTRMLLSFMTADMPIDSYRRMLEMAAKLPPEDQRLPAERLRGMVLSHRDWVMADRVRTGQMARWRVVFREFDVVVCPVMPTPAFPHDHSTRETRLIDIDGQRFAYDDQLVWPGIATLAGLPATALPIGRSETGLPIGAQVIGGFLEDRNTIEFARLVEREYGGFQPPPVRAG